MTIDKVIPNRTRFGYAYLKQGGELVYLKAERALIYGVSLMKER